MKTAFTVLVIFMLILSGESWGSCTKVERDSRNEKGWLWTYTTSRNEQYPYAHTMAFSANALSAVLFDPSIQRNVKLNGRIEDDGHVAIASVTGSPDHMAFEGSFLETDPTGRYGTEQLNCEVLAGTLMSTAGSVSLVFGGEHGYTGSIERRYRGIGASDDELVEANVAKFIRAVGERDKKTVADLILYPVRIGTQRGNKLIHDKQIFLTHFDYIFKPEFSKAIARSRPYHMFVTKYGQALLGTGLVFFIKDGKVSSIANWDK